MAYTAVHDWLARGGTDHAAGLALLSELGKPSPADRFILSLPSSPYTLRLLRSRLVALNDASTLQLTSSRPAKRKVPAPVAERIEQEAWERTMQQEAGTDIPAYALPSKLQPLRSDLKRWHDELKFKRGRLKLTPDGPVLRELADEIVTLRQRINKGWAVLETWRATGEVLLQDQVAVDRADLMKERNTIRVRLSEHKHGKRKLADERVAVLRARLNELTLLIDGAAA